MIQYLLLSGQGLSRCNNLGFTNEKLVTALSSCN